MWLSFQCQGDVIAVVQISLEIITSTPATKVTTRPKQYQYKIFPLVFLVIIAGGKEPHVSGYDPGVEVELVLSSLRYYRKNHEMILIFLLSCILLDEVSQLWYFEPGDTLL